MALHASLVTEIASLCDWFKTIRGLDSETELLNVAEVVSETYWYLKIEEIQFCFKRVKQGLSNVKVLDRMDGSTIMQFIKEYDTTLRVDWSEANANIEKEAAKNDRNIMGEFNREDFYQKGKEYHESLKQKEKQRSVGVNILTEDQKRRQYELILPATTKKEISKMLEVAEKKGDSLLVEMIKEELETRSKEG